MATFLDSNVLVYLADNRDEAKQRKAKQIIQSALMKRGEYWISVQTLTEFINVALKKLKLPSQIVSGLLRYFEQLPIVNPDRELARRGLEIRDMYKIQYYDSVIIAAAERCGATEIFTEDLNYGQLYCGVKAVNPFN